MLNSFHPPVRSLMGPGPSDVSPRVLEAIGRPTIGHLDPSFIDLMDQIKELMQYAFCTKNRLTLPISAPGSAGMESVFVNLVQSGDKVIVCQNGVFGGRMKENIERCGGVAILVEDDWGRAVSPQKVEDALKMHPDAKAVAFVHAETSTGAISDVKTICEIATRAGCLSIVDAVTSLGGSELRVDEWGVDAIYSGTQKCLSCVPGISPVSFSDKAVEVISNRKSRVQSWFLDMNLVMGYWGAGVKRAYHHTAPINALYALHESLLMLKEEGLEKAWERHAYHHAALAAGIEAMGLNFVVPKDERLPQLNSVTVPSGTDEAAVRKALLDMYSLEIGAGLGSLAGKVWRIGLMGYGCNQKNVLNFLGAFDAVLSSMKAPIKRGAAVSAALDVYARST